jgi:tetratricopeptide (TPR) repeat protein
MKQKLRQDSTMEIHFDDVIQKVDLFPKRRRVNILSGKSTANKLYDFLERLEPQHLSLQQRVTNLESDLRLKSLVYAYLEQGEYESAAKASSKIGKETIDQMHAHNVIKRNYDSVIKIAKKLRDEKTLEESVALCDLINEAIPNDFKANYLAGTANLAAGEALAAIPYLRIAVEVNPEHEYANKRLETAVNQVKGTTLPEVKALRDNKEYVASVELAEKYLQAFPGNFQAHYLAGTALLTAGDNLIRAGQHLTEAVKLKPKHEYAQKRLELVKNLLRTS